MNSNSQNFTSPPENTRYHGLDALRAAMMFLGIVLHSAASYITLPTPAWGFKDARTSVFFDLTVFCIHLFRMPVFFVMAGFFAALLYERRGARDLARNRAGRVLIPMVVAWPFLFPLTTLGFDFAARQAGGNDTAVALGRSGPKGIEMDWVLIHLWFLHYLVIFYAAALVLIAIGRLVPDSLRHAIGEVPRRALRSQWRVLFFAVTTAVTLLPMEMGLLETIPSLTPPLHILLAYAVFFGAGWSLYHERGLLPVLETGYWKGILGSLALLPPIMVGVAVITANRALPAAISAMFAAPPGGAGLTAHLMVVGCGSVITWLLIFGLTGLFARRFRNSSPVARYLADASYWVYLVHLPCLIWIAGLLAPASLPALLKFLIVLLATTGISLATYDLGVRSTAIGAGLNGKRYPRALFRAPRKASREAISG